MACVHLLSVANVLLGGVMRNAPLLCVTQNCKVNEVFAAGMVIALVLTPVNAMRAGLVLNANKRYAMVSRPSPGLAVVREAVPHQVNVVALKVSSVLTVKKRAVNDAVTMASAHRTLDVHVATVGEVMIAHCPLVGERAVLGHVMAKVLAMDSNATVLMGTAESAANLSPASERPLVKVLAQAMGYAMVWMFANAPLVSLENHVNFPFVSAKHLQQDHAQGAVAASAQTLAHVHQDG